ncbi:hypothetical protein SAMN02910369_00663 [Lachnospiraceae bacterium NE2001]|nr:hypothetical protein SAMN02910369_00663 [Lachnospiraceae bacterium NE2001]
MIKRTIFGLLLFIIIFIGAALSFNYIHNKDHGERPVEGYNPTMGKAYIVYDGMKINSMQGYTSTLNTSLYRDSIFPVDSSKAVTVMLPDSIDTGADIRYELRSFDGSNLVEDGDFRFIERVGDLNKYSVSLRMDMTEGVEYSFVISAKKDKEAVRFYSRVVRLSAEKLSDFIAYAISFSDAAYAGNKASNQVASTTDAVTTFNVSGTVASLKNETEETSSEETIATSTDAMAGVRVADIASVFSSADAMSSVYSASSVADITSDGNPGYVTLNSSYEDVTYSGMKIERISEPVPKVREVSTDGAVIELKYKAISEDNNVVKTYAVSEYLTLEYNNGEASIDVNDYRRFVNQDFNEEGFDAVTNSISLGITADRTPQFVASENSKVVSFVADNSVWIYNNETRTYSNAYGSSTEEAEKERNPQEGYEIRLLSLEDGLLDFAVFGRINEGPREGQNGVALYEYDIEGASLREISFISSSLSLDAMRLSVGRFCYYKRSERHFYLLLGNQLLDADIFSGQMETLVSGIPTSQIMVSEDGTVVAYPNTGDTINVTAVHILDFKTGKDIEKKEPGHVMALLGFVGEDIMYGVSEPEDASRDVDGTPVFLFDKLYIVHSNGVVVKNYEKEGLLVSGILFDDNTIYLSRIRRNEETGAVEEADDDYLSYKPDEDQSGIKVKIVENEAENEEVCLKLPEYVYVSLSNEEFFTKIIGGSSDVTIDGREIASDENGIYIYAPSGITGVSTSVGKAVQQVYEDGGYVVDSYGSTLYREKQMKPYLTVAGTFDYKAVDQPEDTLAACNYMCLLAAGIDADYDEVRSLNSWEGSFLQYGKEARGVNLSGVKMDTAIGYLSDGFPFAARYEDRFVLVVSYNDDFIRFYDPIADTEVRQQRYLFQLKVNEHSNEFYTYYK